MKTVLQMRAQELATMLKLSLYVSGDTPPDVVEIVDSDGDLLLELDLGPARVTPA